MTKKIFLKLAQGFDYPAGYTEQKFELDLTMLMNRLNLSDKYEAHICISEASKSKNNGEKDQTETGNFIPQEPKYKMEQLVLSDSIRKELMDTLTILEKQHIIYDEWGFSEIDPSPKSILNFYGDPGTGKTMTAQAIANKLGVKIMALNYSEIESKYVGDAPKNLQKAFDIAQKENALLFFDEADSFLGKRMTNVSSGSDQAINSLRSQMLILLENFNGIVIFATNLVKNYDKAFESRIFKHIKFELPNAELRKQLIHRMIPKKVPFEEALTEAQFEALIELSEHFSGRELKNSILLALSSAISAGRTKVCLNDFKESFESTANTKKELNKNKDLSNIVNKKLESGDYKTYKVDKRQENDEKTENNLAE